ncbi:hypothetical protein ACFL1D_04535 [Candidatus Omnitrophota bacterium]
MDEAKRVNQKKGFLQRLIERLDRKMQEKSRQKSGCCQGNKGEKSPCC